MVFSDVSGQLIGPILKEQAAQEDGNDRLSRNVTKYQYTAHNIQEERRSQVTMLAAQGEVGSFQPVRITVKRMGEVILLQSWTDPYGSRRVRLLKFLDSPHVKVVRSPALGTGRLYPQDKPLVLIYVRGSVDPRGHCGRKV